MTDTVLITGATGGIGTALAEQYARHGCTLLLNCAHSEKKLHTLCETLHQTYHVTATPYLADVSSEADVNAMFDCIHKDGYDISLLIHNAGISHIGLLQDMTFAQWQSVIQTNLTSAFLCTRAVIPSMLHRHSGRILMVSSVWGNTGASCEAAYSASKGGLNALAKALAKELAPSNIAVNAVACGAIDTPMNEIFTKEERAAICDEIPAGRFASPAETARFIYQISMCSTYFTGQVVTFDGGWQ